MIRTLADDYRQAEISRADRRMLDYAVRLTKEPWAIRAEDIQDLRDEGFDDRAILDICQITGYFNFVNRLADGLGVELEPYWSEDQILR